MIQRALRVLSRADVSVIDVRGPPIDARLGRRASIADCGLMEPKLRVDTWTAACL